MTYHNEQTTPLPSGWGLHLYLTADEHRKLAEVARRENTTSGKLAQRLVREYVAQEYIAQK